MIGVKPVDDVTHLVRKKVCESTPLSLSVQISTGHGHRASSALCMLLDRVAEAWVGS